MFLICLMAIEDEEERKSIAELYAKHRYHCIHMASKYAYDKNDVEDIVQEVFMRIMRHKDEYLKLDEESFKALLVTITHNIAKDGFKKQKNSPILLDDFNTRAMKRGLSPERMCIIQENFNEVMRELQKYDELSRLIMYYKSMKFPDKTIAEILGIPCRTVGTKVYRIRKELREKCKGDDIFD